LKLANDGLLDKWVRENKINSGCLWAYNYTLPQFCREHPVIVNILHAFEYHQPRMSIREKEKAMNMACSFIVPIEGEMLKILSMMAASNKVRMTAEVGKEMMADNDMWRGDNEDIGSDEDDDSDDEAMNEKQLLAMEGGIDDEEEISLTGFGDDQRKKEREAILLQNQNVDDY